MTDTSSYFSCIRNFLPVGWRFHPSDEELVGDYLKRKLLGDPVHSSDINEVELYKYNPWDLPGIDPSENSSGDKVWYFFNIREYCSNGKLAKRKAGSGSWKITGDPRSVTAEESDEEIGTKRTLVFHNPGATDWVMHEYECIARPNWPVKDNYVLCKIKIKPNKKNKKRAVKRPHKAESDCKMPKTTKKTKKGESNCNIASASASTSASEKENSMPSSTNDKSELCIKKHAISGLGSQNSDKMTATASSCEKGDTSNPYAVDFDNHTQGEINSFSTYSKDETSSLRAFSFNDQNIDQMTDVLNSKIGEMRCYDCDNRSPSEIISISTLEKSETCNLRTHSCKNQNTTQMTDVSTSNEGEVRCMISSVGNCDSYNLSETEMAYMSSDKSNETRWPLMSDLENYSPDQTTKTSSCKKGKPSCSTAVSLPNLNSYETAIVSSNNKGETSCPMNFGYENQNSIVMAHGPFRHMNFDYYENKISIEMAEKSFHENINLSSTSLKGVRKSVLQTPYADNNQNLYEKIDGSIEMAEKSFHENIDLSSASAIGVWKSLLQTPYVDNNQNPYEKIDGSIEMAEKSFHENLDLSSASTIGVRKSVLQTPYVDNNQNLYEKTDGVSLMKEYPSPSMASNVKETTCQEVQSQYKGVDTPVNHRSSLVNSNFRGASLQGKKQTSQYNTTDMPRSCSNIGEATLHKVQTHQSDPADIPIVEDNNLQMTSHGEEAALPKISHELDKVEDILQFFLN